MSEELERLESDLHVLSPVGIERAAWGWDQHERGNLEAYHGAEQAALHAIEQHAAGDEWDQWRSRLFAEVEGRQALIGWRTEHQTHAPHVHKAERAAFGAALGLVREAVDKPQGLRRAGKRHGRGPALATARTSPNTRNRRVGRHGAGALRPGA